MEYQAIFKRYEGLGDLSILISGGDIRITATDDGLNAAGGTNQSGFGGFRGNDRFGTGSYRMAQTFSDSEQSVFAISVGNQAAGTLITLTDKNGNVIVSHTPELSFAIVILSTPEMVKGETYTITVGEASGSFEAA